MLNLLKHLHKKVDAIENHLIKLDVRMTNSETIRSVRTMGTNLEIDVDQLALLNLPVKTESDLEKLEENLETDQEFKKKLVSHNQI